MKKILTFSRIISIIIAILFIGIIVITGIDYFRVRNLKNPKFCLEIKIYEYDDGAVEECDGIVYKVIQYHRTSFDAVEFGPIWTKVKSNISEYGK